MRNSIMAKGIPKFENVDSYPYFEVLPFGFVCVVFPSEFVDAYMTLLELFYPIWTQQLRPSWSRAIFILCAELIPKVFGSPSKDSALPL